ncbi:riboflavin synthase subunit alpha ['Osedax' symbiont bacterium Rs2_46_30_T18]|nr:riboflavin synthase subunit alpha ['Osedax' symbiont bacterium Rs2_46_30_T18]
MFTGIIEAIGQIAAVQMQQGDLQLHIRTGELDLADVAIGDSIATNGVCLTVIDLPGDGFWADVSRETLIHTRFESLQVGERVNLEKALLPSTRMGGHIVTGHVDGIGEIVEKNQDARSIRYNVRAAEGISHYIAAKGSITVDGVSLTVNSVATDTFSLNIVPHTAAQTLMIDYQLGTKVHLEVDIIARYMERLLTAGSRAKTAQNYQPSGLDLAKLAEFGFLK